MGLSSRFNYYEVLELSPNSLQFEVTTAYARAKATYSGDNPAIYTIFSDLEARQLLNMIEEAYAVLGNKTLRSIYDQRLMGGTYDLRSLSYEAILQESKQLYPDHKEGKKLPQHKRNEELEANFNQQTDWTGERLKEVRLYKEISLEKMNEITKVSAFYVSAIEAMAADQLPAPVFVRGYVIQIAKTLGLDSKKVADSYMKNFKNVEVINLKPIE